MKRALALTLFASAAVGFAQQNKDPVSSVVKEILPHHEKNLVAAVEEMPADKFGYKPTPQQMSFARHKAECHIVCFRGYANRHPRAVPLPASTKEVLMAKKAKRSTPLCNSRSDDIREAFLQLHSFMWFCAKCGQTSDHLAKPDAIAELSGFECSLVGTKVKKLTNRVRKLRARIRIVQE